MTNLFRFSGVSVLVSLVFVFTSAFAEECPKIKLIPEDVSLLKMPHDSDKIKPKNTLATRGRMVSEKCKIEDLYSCEGGVLIVSTSRGFNGEMRVAPECYKKDDKEMLAMTEGRKILTPDSSKTQVQVKGSVAEADAASLRKEALAKGIPEVIFDRAFANYKDLLAAGKTTRGCFMATDLTTKEKGESWMICLKPAVSITKTETYYGRGMGENCVNHMYRNQYTTCAKHFGNKVDYCLSAGGRYVTSTAVYNSSEMRAFTALIGLQKDENDNTEARHIGIHQTVYAKDEVRPHMVAHKPANYVGEMDPSRFSQGCVTVSPDLDAFDPTNMSSTADSGGLAVYVYPEKKDILAFRNTGKAEYWNAECAKKIGKPSWIGTKDFAADMAPGSDGKYPKETLRKPTADPESKPAIKRPGIH